MIRCQFENGTTALLRHVVVDVLVFDSEYKHILLVRRATQLVEGGKLGVIGGFLELNENCKQAAQREVLEETGYDISDLQLIHILDGPRPLDNRQNVAFVYTAIATKKVGTADAESTEQLWIPLTELPAREHFAFDHFDHIMRYLESMKQQGTA